MAAGVRPFHGQSGFELTSAILSQAPRPLPPQVPAELCAVVGRCLEKEPGKGYQQAGEFAVGGVALPAYPQSLADSWAACSDQPERDREDVGDALQAERQAFDSCLLL
jgi:hypothetical protein